MTIRGFLRGLRIYLRDWRPPPHVIFGLMFGAFGVACGARFMSGFFLGVILSPCWEVAVRKGWIAQEKQIPAQQRANENIQAGDLPKVTR